MIEIRMLDFNHTSVSLFDFLHDFNEINKLYLKESYV